MKKGIKDLLRRNGPKKAVTKLSTNLESNIELFKNQVFLGDGTVIFRRFKTNGLHQLRCALIFVDQMIDKLLISENVIAPLMAATFSTQRAAAEMEALISSVVSIDDLKVESEINVLAQGIMQGDSLLLIDGFPQGIILSTRGWAMRAITEPESEKVVRGPREGFNESIAINLTMVRRKLNTDKLRIEFREIGARSNTKIAVVYLSDIASPEILEEVKRRLANIKIDAVLESGYLEEMIKDSPESPFRTIGNTERPDVVAAKLLEGRIAIFCDGTPFVLTIPYVFQEAFQANEDYYQNFFIASLNRMLRYFAFFLTTSTSAIYLALITYHQEMIPTPLLMSISAAREGVPFPTVFEVLAMTLVFEILREGGVRLPSPIGQAISIVGAIVLGDAAVTAQMVSAPMVIVIALTGISSFVIPRLIGVVLVIRIIFILLASILGLYGYIYGVIGLFIQLCAMRSFGVPYLTNLASFRAQDVKDTAIRAPWWLMAHRPKLIASRNQTRQRKKAKR